MPRPKTRADAEVLAAALRLVHARGPEALTFASLGKATGLSGSTLVQRFRTKADLVQATLLHAWDALDADTARVASLIPRTPERAIRLLVELSRDYGGIETFAEGLLLLREDLRDPVLRARGAAWKSVLVGALDACFADTVAAPAGVGLLMASQWQGSLLWWSFDPREPVEAFVEAGLRRFVHALVGAAPVEPGQPVLFGAGYSVYVRAVRLALAEKGVAYAHVPVDVFAPGGPPAEHLARHPFGRIPAFRHGGFQLYEAAAIARYVDEAFAGPPLQPGEPRGRARMAQVIGVMDSYAYRTLVWDIYVERVSRPRAGKPTDEARVAAALPAAERCLGALAALLGEQPWLAGAERTLADLHAAPMFDYFLQAPEAAGLMAPWPALSRWWARMSARPSMNDTEPD